MSMLRIAELLEELAAEIRRDAEAPAAPKSKPRRRRLNLVRPDGEASPAVSRQAQRILRDRGYR